MSFISEFWTLIVVTVLTLSIVAHAKEHVILDTDLGCDIDDVGALAILHALADKGEVEILAIGVVNPHPNAVPGVDMINTWYGRADVPIGTIKRDTGVSHDRYLATPLKTHAHTLTKDAAEDVVNLYRRVLSKSEDRSVTLIAIGPPSNISDLLDSGADDISPLSGAELMKQKLKFYAAGGNGRGGLPDGESGWNYQDDLKSASNELAKLPSDFPTVFAGGSGMKIEVGECYRDAKDGHIGKTLFANHFRNKPRWMRASWDQLRTLYACRPDARKLFDLSPFGDISLDGKTLHFAKEPNRNRAYAYVKDLDAVRKEVEGLMLYDPRDAKTTNRHEGDASK